MSSNQDSVAPSLKLQRTWNVAPLHVFQAFTDARKLARWWGPHGFSNPVCKVDPRPGGELYIEMQGPAGSPWEQPFPMYGAFVEVVEPQRIVFTAIIKDGDDSIVLKNINTVTFERNGTQTSLTLEVHVAIAGAGSEGPLSGMAEGWTQSLERLQAFVECST